MECLPILVRLADRWGGGFGLGTNSHFNAHIFAHVDAEFIIDG